MKRKIAAVMMAMGFGPAVAGSKEPQPLARSDEGKHVFAEVINLCKANDTHDLVKKFPEMERLWDKDPIGYLQVMESSVYALVSSNEPDLTDALLKALGDVMKKRCPADAEVASFYFSMKSDIIGYGSRCAALRKNGESLLMTADLVGEIRSRKIVGYQPRKVQNPGREILEAAGVERAADLPAITQKDAVAKAIEENKKNEQMDRLQEALSTLDENLIQYLVISTRELSLPETEKADLSRKLAQRALFTDEEVKKLNQPR